MGEEWRKVTESEATAAEDAAHGPWGARAPGPLQAALIGLARRSVLRRGVFRAHLTRAIFAMRSGPLDVRFRGAAFRLHGESNLMEHALLLNPLYNAADIDFLLDGADADANFLDIGSNLGLYSQPLALAAPKGQVLAIDANPKMIARITWNAGATGLSNLRIVHAAVSDREGAGELMIRKDDEAIVAIEETATGDVPVRPLAALVAEAGITAIHGLKIDIEGHEDKALVPFLDGAERELLPRRIVIEHPEPDRDYPGCTDAFARHGYQLVKRTRNNSLYRLGRPAGSHAGATRQTLPG